MELDHLLGTVHSLLHMPEDFEKLLNAPERNYVQDTKAAAATPVDVTENSSAYVFQADMPGLSNSDIKVEVENENVLSISGKRKRDDKAEEGTKYIRMERRPTKFMRKFTLPGDVNMEGITASCQDGVLTVTVPKTPPEPQKPKAINIPVS